MLRHALLSNHAACLPTKYLFFLLNHSAHEIYAISSYYLYCLRRSFACVGRWSGSVITWHFKATDYWLEIPFFTFAVLSFIALPSAMAIQFVLLCVEITHFAAFFSSYLHFCVFVCAYSFAVMSVFYWFSFSTFISLTGMLMWSLVSEFLLLLPTVVGAFAIWHLIKTKLCILLA